MSLFDPQLENLPRAALEQLQLERLQALLARLKRNVRRYRETLGDFRLESLDDAARLPFTTAGDLAAAFPYGMFALPLQEVIRLHSTVGPEGRPLVVGHTRNDLRHWGQLVARELAAADVTAHDVIQICFGGAGLGPALGYLRGAETIETSTIPTDPHHIEYQLAMLQSYKATVLVTTPANAHDLADLLADRRIDPPAVGLRTVFLSRPVPAAERAALKTGLFADIHCSFGVPEILDPGLGVECHEGRLHANEDAFLVEAQSGELIVTTLTREAMPLLRYRTGIAGAVRREKCPCGRTGAVIQPGGRLDQRLRVNEVPLYEAQIGEVLRLTRAADHPFHIDIGERRVIVSVEVTDALFSDTMRTLADLKIEIQSAFLSRLGVEAEVRYVGRGHHG